MEKKRKPFNAKLFYRRTCLIIYDIISIWIASYAAILWRYDFHLDSIPDHFMRPIELFMPINILVTLVIFYIMHLYSSLWAFAGETELQNIVVACVMSMVVDGIGLQFFKIMTQAVPRSYYVAYLASLVVCIFASRFSYRFFRGLKHKQQNKKNLISVMVIGAGEAANLIIKEIVNSNFSTMVIKCIIDDDKGKWGRYIQGIKVVGGRDKIVECADVYDVDEIIVAMPSAPRAEIRGILEICKDTNCKLRSLPGMYQLVNGEVNVSKLRDVEVEDLLGRDPISVDMDSILGYVQGKVVLVTGGGGSIGSELCRQIAAHKAKQLVIVDIYENSVYDIQQELKKKYPELNLIVLIASVRNTNRMNYIFSTYRPDIVYHAAAHKHVSCHFMPQVLHISYHRCTLYANCFPRLIKHHRFINKLCLNHYVRITRHRLTLLLRRWSDQICVHINCIGCFIQIIHRNTVPAGFLRTITHTDIEKPFILKSHLESICFFLLDLIK